MSKKSFIRLFAMPSDNEADIHLHGELGGAELPVERDPHAFVLRVLLYPPGLDARWLQDDAVIVNAEGGDLTEHGGESLKVRRSRPEKVEILGGPVRMRRPDHGGVEVTSAPRCTAE